jgi:hypothetical protein
MRQARSFLLFVASISLVSIGVTGCGSSDDTAAPDGAGPGSAVDASSDGAREATVGPDAAGFRVDGADAAADAPIGAPVDATVDASPDAPIDAQLDAGTDVTVDAPSDVTSAPDAGLDVCSLPDAALPDAAIGNTGATTTSCLGCVGTTCASQAAACNGDCVCAADAIAVFACVASGQSALGCLTSVAGSSAFTALSLCVILDCHAQCGF